MCSLQLNHWTLISDYYSTILAPIKPNQRKSIKSVPEFYTLSDTTALRLNQDYLTTSGFGNQNKKK